MARIMKGAFLLVSDLDLGGKEWTPIGTDGNPFWGGFDGGGHTITGIDNYRKGSPLCGSVWRVPQPLPLLPAI